MLEYCVELDIEYDSGICFVIGTTESYFIYYFFIMRIYMHFLEGSMVPKKIFFLCVVVVVGFCSYDGDASLGREFCFP